MKFVTGENWGNLEKTYLGRVIHQETHFKRQRRELGNQAVGGERLTTCATATRKKKTIDRHICLKNLTSVYPLACVSSETRQSVFTIIKYV